MKRRGFLHMLTASIAAPFIPAPVAARGAAYGPAALQGAIRIAQTRAVFSVWGLSKTLGIKLDAAEALMGELSQRGILGPVQGATRGGRWASSNVLLRDMPVRMASANHARAKAPKINPPQKTRGTTKPDLSRLLAYLRDLARANGHDITGKAALA